MSAVVDQLTRLGGVATRRDLLTVATARELAATLQAGLVQRPQRGRYVLPLADEARRVAHELTAVVSLRSAALAHGWKVQTTPDRPEVTVARNRKVTPAMRRRAHIRHSALAAHDVENGVTVPLRTVVDCARSLPLGEALSVADSALRSRMVTAAQLRQAEAAVWGAGRARVLRVLRNASAKAANPFESALRAIGLEVPGLDLQPQVGIHIAGVRVAPDLVDVSLSLVVEADSHEFHTQRDQLTSDCWRYDELVLGGWRVFRFTWDQVMFQQAWVRSVLERAVGLLSVQTDKPILASARSA